MLICVKFELVVLIESIPFLLQLRRCRGGPGCERGAFERPGHQHHSLDPARHVAQRRLAAAGGRGGQEGGERDGGGKEGAGRSHFITSGSFE